jgi:hypothetical protein
MISYLICVSINLYCTKQTSATIFRVYGDIVTIIGRLFFIIIAIAGIAYGSIWALATLVEPEQRETSISVPQTNFAR